MCSSDLRGFDVGFAEWRKFYAFYKAAMVMDDFSPGGRLALPIDRRMRHRIDPADAVLRLADEFGRAVVDCKEVVRVGFAKDTAYAFAGIVHAMARWYPDRYESILDACKEPQDSVESGPIAEQLFKRMGCKEVHAEFDFSQKEQQHERAYRTESGDHDAGVDSSLLERRDS